MEVLSEQGRIQCGGHEHQTQLGLAGQQIPQHDQKEICKLVALMYLVHHNVGNILESFPAGQHSQQNPIGAEHEAAVSTASASQ